MEHIKPKLVTFDIETSAQKGYYFGPKWETNVAETFEDTQVIAFTMKWLDGKRITRCLSDYKGYKAGVINDKEIVKDIARLSENVDIWITQNGKAFDMKVMNARYAYHNIAPQKPTPNIDLKLEAKRWFRLPSYALNDMCRYFGIERKQEHEGFPLWLKFEAGHKPSHRKMKSYCENDGVITEKLYKIIRPFMSSHPNMGNYLQDIVCPKCGSDKLQSRGLARNTTTVYRRFQCQSCGGWGRATHNENKIKLITSI